MPRPDLRRPERRFYTIAEIAERWGVHSRTVQRVIEQGELVVHRLGRSVRVSDADLIEYEHRCRDR